MKIAFDQAPGTRLAVVVPMFNEVAGADTCVRRLLSVLPRAGMPAGLIVVDDGSSDGTGALLDRLRGVLGPFDVVHKRNGGYGSALVAGARFAQEQGYDFVLFIDSDLTNPPEHIARFVPAIRAGIDLAKGSRFSKDGNMAAVPRARRLVSTWGNMLASALFRVGISDCTNGFRAIRIELFTSMPLAENGFAIILEELYWAKKLGARIASVPTSLSARHEKQRPTSFVIRPKLVWSYLRHALRASIIPYRRLS
jgi:glycosyltransferase involved in cell wall biosynthesis